MSRGNVFKLSGNLALGGATDTYSTNELQSIKSSLRLLKARQSQKKSQQNIDINGNYGVSYSSNAAQRSEIRRNDNKDYNYFQSNAKNHVPSYDNGYGMGQDQQPVGKTNSKTSIYENDKYQQRDRNGNSSSMNKNDYGSRNNDYGSRNNNNNTNDYNYNYDNGPSIKEQSARNPIKQRTEQPKTYNDEDYYNNPKPSMNAKNQQQQDIRAINNKTQTRPPLRKQQLNQQAQSYSSPVQNNHEQLSLKEVNRENKAEIVEYDPSTFVVCTVGCGRKFNPDSISKHQAICYKVFQKKRKEFNAQEQRVLDAQHKQIVKTVMVEEKKAQKQKTNKNAGKNDEKMNKWKAQSLALRAMIKDNRGEQVSGQQRKVIEEAKNMGMVKCPHCGRSFNQSAGPKHITFCQNQSKKGKFKR